ncbi:MAG: molybdate ABC transporter substrate-binding protein [Alphaproteobacteria bacterium]|nr:molybdate ABC transporter substrate-binding protein [Alphaproteobacteria bacterium]MDE2109602.1 molybdate ABC transporter substrate-binding protein [Alphaproteobacteria bacterium]
MFKRPTGALLAFGIFAAASHAAGVTVFAAASLTNALQQAADAYKHDTGHAVTLSFAASSTLARQIESSSGADIFISADIKWMDYLQTRGLIAPGTRVDLLGNQLVLIAPAASPARIAIEPHFDLAKALDGGKLALADPASVPAGIYAKAALVKLGVWDSVAGKVAPAENVRVALAYVARGEAPFGIVYATDAKIEPQVRIVAAFPDGSYPKIVYPAALTKDAKPEARAFLNYLSSAAARAIFVKFGFTPPGK